VEKRDTDPGTQLRNADRRPILDTGRRSTGSTPRATPRVTPRSHGDEDATQVRWLRRDIETLRKDKQEYEKTLLALQNDLHETKARAEIAEKEKEAIVHRPVDLWHTPKVAAPQITNDTRMQAELHWGTGDLINAVLGRGVESKMISPPMLGLAQKRMQYSQSARSLRGPRTRWLTNQPPVN